MPRQRLSQGWACVCLREVAQWKATSGMDPGEGRQACKPFLSHFEPTLREQIGIQWTHWEGALLEHTDATDSPFRPPEPISPNFRERASQVLVVLGLLAFGQFAQKPSCYLGSPGQFCAQGQLMNFRLAECHSCPI